MKKLVRPLVLCLLIVFVSVLIASFIKQSQIRQRKESSLFDGECKAPCWRHITPGNTTMQEAYDLISGFSDRGIKKIERTEDLQGLFNAVLSFELSSGIKVYIYAIDDVVALIAFRDDVGIATFGRCVEEFGSPQFAGQSCNCSSEEAHIFFTALIPQRGISYYFDRYTYFGPKKTVSRRSVVTGIRYFDIKYYETLLQHGRILFSETGYDENDLHPWVGYGNIFELYPYDPYDK